MSDELHFSGNGGTAVATDALLCTFSDLVMLASRLDWAMRSVHRAESVMSVRTLLIPNPCDEAIRELCLAQSLLARAHHSAGLLSQALRTSAEAYGFAEQVRERAARELASVLGYGVGYLFPILVMSALPLLGSAAAGILLASLTSGGPGTIGPTLGRWLRQNNVLLTNPLTVELIRNAAMSADDSLGGAAQIPFGLVRLLGDEGLGIAGLAPVAALMTVIGSPLGVFAEAPVSVTATKPDTVDCPPGGLAERVDRIPDPAKNEGGEQIRIDRYHTDGEPDRFEVYIAGTVDFSPVADGEAFDLTSNVHGIAQLPAGSLRAVEQALAHEGVTSSSPVIFTGYSQGGLLAATLAASGDYNARGVFTIGAPAGQIEIPPHIPVIAIEHSDDLVPALGGTRLNHDALLVERQAFAQSPIPHDVAVPAHERTLYRETAAMVDAAGNTALAAKMRAFNHFADGATTITSVSFRAQRATENTGD